MQIFTPSIGCKLELVITLTSAFTLSYKCIPVQCEVWRTSNGFLGKCFSTVIVVFWISQVIYINNECEGFIRGSKHRETDESTRP